MKMLREQSYWSTLSFLLAVSLLASPASSGPAAGPLRVLTTNPQYFTDGSGRAVYLAGSHEGWELQDYAWEDKPDATPFAWQAFLDSMVSHGENLSRMWMVENTRHPDPDAKLTVPMAYERAAGGGTANDGENRFDLDRFNETYFKRMHSRVREAGDRGVYVIVMLFQGWSIYQKRDSSGSTASSPPSGNPWTSHPFNRANNINGFDGDLNGDGQGKELHTWLGESHPITQRERAYVRKVIDTVNDLDNVLYEIANESHLDSIEWQYKMIDFVHAYERGKPKQHPVGMTVPFEPKHPGPNSVLFDSPADWISPSRGQTSGDNYRGNPPVGDGRKVLLVDTDHVFGLGCKDPSWVWKTFCRGHNCLYMDAWTQAHPDPARERVRDALGYTRRYASRMELSRTVPRPELASTGYCLVNPGRQYLVYIPKGVKTSVDVSGVPGHLSVEWFNPQTGITQQGDEATGGARCEFSAPFAGPAVLYLTVEKTEPASASQPGS